MQWIAVLILLTPCLVSSTITLVTTAVKLPPTPQVVASTTTRVERIDPRITHIARTVPKQVVRIIVQKLGSDQHVEQQIASLGGNILSDLPIINAFAAEVSADSAYQLAQSPSVRWISIDAQVQSTLLGVGDTNEAEPSNSYLDTLGIPALWQRGLSGQGIGIAIIDSGVARDNDFTNLGLTKGFNLKSLTPTDLYGHGTHIAGIVAGNGNDSNGKYKGIAPGTTLIGLKVSDDLGLAFESDVVKALQWVYDHKAQYNIRIINLSINSGVEASYHNSPLNAAAEILWFSGVVVIVSAGNSGEQNGYNTIEAPPANDPFLITVGASDERGTSAVDDDIVAPYSAYGTTADGFLKPDIIAPGAGIYSVRAELSPWGVLYPDRLAGEGQYFRLSGTSMAAPMVVGVVALMLQDEPNLMPDQVKYRLLNSTRRSLSVLLDSNTVSFPYLDGARAVNGTTTKSANTGLAASQLLWSGSSPVNWGSVNWNSVNWNSVNWNSVNWNSAVLEPPAIAGILPLAQDEGWQVPARPTEIPDFDHEHQLDRQADNYIFLPTVAHQ